ncbi:MAG: hypothetical protein KF718_13600 [Polyangiaceae bacterium]|nr:hypothetical protein [Polyangiaceae bacterium]
MPPQLHPPPPARRGLEPRRLRMALLAALLAGAAAYGISAVVALATCETGSCPVGEAPWPFIALLALVAGGAVVASGRD